MGGIDIYLYWTSSRAVAVPFAVSTVFCPRSKYGTARCARDEGRHNVDEDLVRNIQSNTVQTCKKNVLK